MRRFLKIVGIIVSVILILILILSLLLSIPKVQTALAQRLTSYLNTEYHTDINIQKIDLSYVGQIQIKQIFIKDPQKDTIFYVDNLQTSLLNFKNVLDEKLEFSDIYLSRATVKMKTYKGEKEDELIRFVNKLDTPKSNKPHTASKFLLTSDKLHLNQVKFILIDENKQQAPIVSYSDISGDAFDFKIEGSNVYGKIRDVSLKDMNGLEISDMDTDFSYSRTAMYFLNTRIQTKTSDILGDIKMTYNREDLADFINKVQIEAEIPKARVSLGDMKHFYQELGTEDVFYFSTNIQGTLNDFTAKKLHLSSKKKAKINGDIRLINSFQTEKGFELVADLINLESDYKQLSLLLPKLLGENLPQSFGELGHFSVSGKTRLQGQKLNANIIAHTALGDLQTDIFIHNITEVEKASYEGDIYVKDLKLGKIADDSSIGNLTMNAHIAGAGFTLDALSTQVQGRIIEYQYKGYHYQNVAIKGNVKDKRFAGIIQADDPNLKFNFEGLADLSKEKYKLDFKSHIDKIAFHKLHLFQVDSLALLKGDVVITMLGNRLENMQGSIHITNATYTNQVQAYHFKDFDITSGIKDSIQTLKINSSDIVNGQIKGKFIFNELSKLAQNAFGSIYTNYKAFEVSPKQKLDFRFKIHNQVVNIFFPELTFGKNTSIRGRIDSDKNLFQLTFKSPEILLFDNFFDKIRLQIDNKNPLFNTQLSIEKVETKLYDIADFNLVNITLNDSLRFRSEFKGGSSLQDNYNLSFYHTINEKNQSIIGFENSSITFNNTDWKLNAENDKKNKIIIDNGNIMYDDFVLTSGDQTLLFYGEEKGENYKNYNIDLDRINLAEITPDFELFDFEGLINGGVWIEKRNNMLIPTADVQILDLIINAEPQGDLIAEIKGSDSNKKYKIDCKLVQEDTEIISAIGNLNFKPQKPSIDLNFDFNQYSISILNVIGEGVMEDIRGTVSGKASLKGKIENPNLSGILTLNDSGVYFPFINVDYAFDNDSKVYLNNQSFTIRRAKVFDTLYETEGTLSGSISHHLFKKWFLDLKIDTNNLLALNTPEEEESMFYGTGFLRGVATFEGDTDNINITINGSSNPGTEIIIPMSDIKTVETSELIHFKKPDKKNTEDLESLRNLLSSQMSGLTMDFNLDITKDATIQIVIDKSSGSSLQGNGTGAIQMEIDTKGTFNMYGEYIVDRGFYNFKYGGVINKAFTVERGGSISFYGDPFKAELDIEAIYTTKANPKAILPEFENNRRIPIELITKLKGELFHSKQEFDIKIPNADIDLSSELEFVLNDKDTGNMMTQFVSLLATGSFFNTENNISYTGANLVNDNVINNTAALISNALLDIFSDPDDKIQLGFDYTQGNKIIDTENQFGVSLATRLGKNEKIIINGEVNVPTGSQSNANIAGNVSVAIPLNKKETMMMKVFNRQNEIQYSNEAQGYTQGIGVSWQMNFDLNKIKFPVEKDSISNNTHTPLEPSPKKDE